MAGIPSDMGWTIQKIKGFDPRIGVTYQLDDKTVIRAGYGRSFDTGVFGSIFGHVVTQNLPVLANQSVQFVGPDGCVGRSRLTRDRRRLYSRRFRPVACFRRRDTLSVRRLVRIRFTSRQSMRGI